MGSTPQSNLDDEIRLPLASQPRLRKPAPGAGREFDYKAAVNIVNQEMERLLRDERLSVDQKRGALWYFNETVRLRRYANRKKPPKDVKKFFDDVFRYGFTKLQDNWGSLDLYHWGEALVQKLKAQCWVDPDYMQKVREAHKPRREDHYEIAGTLNEPVRAPPTAKPSPTVQIFTTFNRPVGMHLDNLL